MKNPITILLLAAGFILVAICWIPVQVYEKEMVSWFDWLFTGFSAIIGLGWGIVGYKKLKGK